MSVYSAKYRLVSCKVTKDLLKDIESYILAEAKALIEGSSAEAFSVNQKFHIIIETGEEHLSFSGIDEYEGAKLPDGTKSVIMEYASVAGKYFHIKAVFHSSFAEHASVEITLADNKAKITVDRIARVIKDMVKEKKTFSYVFHNRGVQLSLLFFYALYNVYSFFRMNVWPDENLSPYFLSDFILFSLFMGALGIWFIFSIFLRKYTRFETPREKIITISYYGVTLLYFAALALFFYSKLAEMNRFAPAAETLKF